MDARGRNTLPQAPCSEHFEHTESVVTTSFLSVPADPDLVVGSAVQFDPNGGIVRAGPDHRGVVGIAVSTVDGNGAAMIATNGVVSLTEAEWATVAGGPLVPGAIYWTTAEGQLTRDRPSGQATQIGIAITTTEMRVEIHAAPNELPPKPAWPRLLPDSARVELAALAGLREIHAIWRGYGDGYWDATITIVVMQIDDHVTIFVEEDGGGEGSHLGAVYQMTFAAWALIAGTETPSLAPIHPSIVANFVHHASDRLDLLYAIDERIDRRVLEIGTKDIGEYYPSFVFNWDPTGYAREEGEG
jgi:hypothetical protein